VPVGSLKSIFDFQHAALHCFRRGRKRGPVRDGRDFLLCGLARLSVKSCGLCEAREQEKGEDAGPSGSYSQFVLCQKSEIVEACRSRFRPSELY
jgi:hypothetical protein